MEFLLCISCLPGNILSSFERSCLSCDIACLACFSDVSCEIVFSFCRFCASCEIVFSIGIFCVFFMDMASLSPDCVFFTDAVFSCASSLFSGGFTSPKSSKRAVFTGCSSHWLKKAGCPSMKTRIPFICIMFHGVCPIFSSACS